jgi:YD repeat-containing protein
MKETFGTILLICFLILSCSKPTVSADAKNDISQYGLNGKVKIVESKLFNLIPQNDTFIIGEKINAISFDRNSQMEFDQRGYLTSNKEFLANNELSFEIKYTYDANHRLIRRQEIDHYGKGSFYIYDFTYNAQDSLIKGVISNDDFKRIHKMERDNENRIIRKQIIQSDSILGTYTYTYDQNGNMVEEKDYRKSDIPEELINRTFDENNILQKEEIITYLGKDTLTSQNLFYYNKTGDLIKTKMKVENDSIYTEVINKYYDNGNLRETQNIPTGNKNSHIITQRYNKNGDGIEYSRKTKDGEISDIWIFNYKYDSNKNWVEKSIFKNNKPLRIVKRKIKYY